MTASEDTKITEHFPHKTIPPIVGQPTYEAIKELHLKLNENALKVHSNLGNGMLGFLGVTVTPAIYNTLLAQLFIIPPNSGTAPVFPDHSTGPHITNIRTAFKDDFTAFKKYEDMCNAISAIILEVMDPVYLATLRLPYIGIGIRTPLQILAHLYTNYAKITPADLDNNDRAMKQPCNVSNPSKSFTNKSKTLSNLRLWGKPRIHQNRSSTSFTNWFFAPASSQTIAKSGNAKPWRTKYGHNSNWISLSPTKSTVKHRTSLRVQRASTRKILSTTMKTRSMPSQTWQPPLPRIAGL
jgi:hypothetical protein